MPAREKTIDTWRVYLLRCADDTLYCGATNDLEKRIAAHNSGRGGHYTRGRRPVCLETSSSPMTRSEALRLEWQIKNTPRDMKVGRLKAAKAAVSSAKD